MTPELSDSLETPRRGIAEFLRGEVTDRFLGGVGFSAAAAAPITLDVELGDEITRVTDEIPAFTTTIPGITPTIPALTTTIPEQTANFGRFVTSQITEVTSVTPTITRTPDVIG
jgi:hypothetical protein